MPTRPVTSLYFTTPNYDFEIDNINTEFTFMARVCPKAQKMAYILIIVYKVKLLGCKLLSNFLYANN
jgi:hypothetical protein